MLTVNERALLEEISQFFFFFWECHIVTFYMEDIHTILEDVFRIPIHQHPLAPVGKN